MAYYDITTANHGTLVGLTPNTDAGEAWLTEHLPDDVQCLGTTRFCEPRYAHPIIAGMLGDGLRVE